MSKTRSSVADRIKKKESELERLKKIAEIDKLRKELKKR
jgi:hypothetical protein